MKLEKADYLKVVGLLTLADSHRRQMIRATWRRGWASLASFWAVP